MTRRPPRTPHKRYRIVNDYSMSGKRFGVIDQGKPLIGQWCHSGVYLDIAGCMRWLEKQRLIA